MFMNMWSLRVGLIMFFFPYCFLGFHIIASLPICTTLIMDVILLLSNFFFCNTIVFVEISENAGYVFFFFSFFFFYFFIFFLSIFSYLGTNSIDVVGQENKIESTFLYIQMEYCPQ